MHYRITKTPPPTSLLLLLMVVVTYKYVELMSSR